MADALLLAAGLYFLSFSASGLALFLVRGRGPVLAGAAAFGLRLAWCVHLFALAQRWLARGWPTSFAETMIFFAWLVAGAHLWLERRFRERWPAFFSAGLALCAIACALLSGDDAAVPPAELRSPLYLVQLTAAGLGYAFLLAAASLALLFLVRDGVSPGRLSAAFATLACLVLAFSGGPQLIAHARVELGGAPAPGAGPLWLAAVALFGYHAFAGWVLGSGSSWVFAGAMASVSGVLASFGWAMWKVPGFHQAAQPARLAPLVFVAMFGGAFLALPSARSALAAKLPEAEKLDRWSYQAVLLSFLFLTAALLGGGIWAYIAKGRYWGWDPREIRTLTAWVLLVIYLHRRELGGWEGRRPALLALAGAVILFLLGGKNVG